jgi:hypothetical protein
MADLKLQNQQGDQRRNTNDLELKSTPKAHPFCVYVELFADTKMTQNLADSPLLYRVVACQTG